MEEAALLLDRLAALFYHTQPHTLRNVALFSQCYAQWYSLQTTSFEGEARLGDHWQVET